MLDTSPIDHLFVAVFAVAYPLYALWSYPRFKKKIELGMQGARSRDYRQIMAWLWGLSLCGLVIWVLADRPLDAVGLGTDSGWRLWTGLGAVGVLWFLMMMQRRQLRRSEEARESYRRQLEAVKDLLPATAQEMRLFAALSITAGICEEFLYRGYLMAYLAPFAGTIVAAIVSCLVFGLAHSYQGAGGAMRAGLLGAGFVALYLFTESLWVPMLLHALVDIHGGTSSRLALSEPTGV